MDGVIRRLRLASGLVMLAYVTTHFVNHSLGLISVQAMDRALVEIYKYWASPLGGVLLYGIACFLTGAFALDDLRTLLKRRARDAA